jgi:HEPN domain-containing protein
MKENKKYRRTKMPHEQGNLVAGFFIAAYEDYIAARQLLLNNLLSQGCILANTSIEKYFKAMKVILNEPIPRHHDITVQKFKNTIKNKFQKIHNLINFEFVEFLSKSYKLRYYDEVPINYNIAIIRRKTLSELDFLVSEIENSFQITIPSIGEVTNSFKTDKQNRNPLLWNDNYRLNGFDKKQFIEGKDNVYELRKLINGKILQVHYVTEHIVDDGRFIYEALKPEPENSDPTFSFCFELFSAGASL